MRLLLATNHLGLGGSESYLLTIAEQLDRLGHELAIYAPEPEGGAEVAREKGLVVLGEEALDDEHDAALVQDAGVSLQIADRCPRLPQLFVAHSADFDLQAPPRLGGVVGIAVVLNDRVGRRMRSFATEVEIVRMRQPIDVRRFAPRGHLPSTPRTALLLSNTPHADRLNLLRSACARAGLELTLLGGEAGRAADVRPALAGAEIVVGYGRSILEAMAMGRAAYVYDWKGGDGWITPESYPAIEADGLAGSAGVATVDLDRLSEDMRGYSDSMGPVNRDLVVSRHNADAHVQELIGLLHRLVEPIPRSPAPLQEMARLVRLEWRAQLEINGLKQENAHLRESVRETGTRAEEARAEAAREAKRVDELRRAFEASNSWRITRPLRALGRLRRRRTAARGGSGPDDPAT